MSPATADATRVMTPVQPEERIVVLNVLCGFALLGIPAVNLPGAAASGFGRLEWLWRGATYGRMPKLRSAPAEVTATVHWLVQ